METRFIVDTTVGKLARWLRSLGFDTLVFRERDLHRLVQIAQEQKRIILTRNRKLEAKLFLGNIFVLKDDDPDLQVKTILRTLSLRVDSRIFFSRCLLCNAQMESISRGEAEGAVPEYVLHTHESFYRCPACERIYWQGTHPRNMRRRIEKVLASVNNRPGQDPRSGV
jgi:uncharacterized protein with PIN domain